MIQITPQMRILVAFSLALLAACLMVLLGLMALLNLFFRLGPL